MGLLDNPPPGANPHTLRHLRSCLDSGFWVLVESAIADLPTDLRWLVESGALDIIQMAALHTALGSVTVADLMDDVRRGAIRGVAGLDAGVEAGIAAALPTLRRAVPRIPLGRAVATVEPVLKRLHDMPGVAWALPVGSLRRGQDTIGDLEVVAPTNAPSDVLDAVARTVDADRLRHRSTRRLYVQADRVQLGVRCPSPEAGGAALIHLTGHPAHVDRLYRLAASRGLVLDPRGLRSSDAGRPLAASEEEIYAALGLPFIPPEIRDGDEELAAASEGRLPRLVTRLDIRGDLHMHTHWSDGHDSIEGMVRAAAALGYEYLAITDHSPSSAAVRSLTLDGVQRQADEIAEIRERYPQIEILHGVEVDILSNGRLDFSDRILRTFDLVLASLHDQANHAPDELMRRYLGAMRHPLVTIVTHPTNRLVPLRPGYDLPYRRLFEAAVETRTVLEVDGAPTHLDLDGDLARQAVNAGVTLSIDSDAHRSDVLERQMQLGITTARRGWVEARHVLNSQPIREIRALVAAKRRG